MSNPHGSFIWYELTTSDPAAAIEFYRAVVGWTARDSGMPDVSYTLFGADGADVAGAMSIPEDAKAAGLPPNWTGYVAVDDVDRRTEEVARAGGRVHVQPQDIPGVGRFSIVSDPQGAMLALMTPLPREGGGAPASRSAPGHGGWHELMAADWPAAFAFYAKLFGWTKAEAIDMGPMGTYQLFAKDGESIGGMMTKPAEVEAPPAWLFYFNVAGIDAAKARIEAGGGAVVNGPMEVPGGAWIVQGRDPQGAMFALVGPKG